MSLRIGSWGRKRTAVQCPYVSKRWNSQTSKEPGRRLTLPRSLVGLFVPFVASLLLVVGTGAPSSVRSLLVAMPRAPSSFPLLSWINLLYELDKLTKLLTKLTQSVSGMYEGYRANNQRTRGFERKWCTSMESRAIFKVPR